MRIARNAILFLLAAIWLSCAGKQDKLVLGVGLFQPNPELNQKTYQPLADYLSQAIGREIELKTVDTWVGFGNAFKSGELDMGLLGPWGYVISNAVSGCQAVAVIEYDGLPNYHALIVTNQDDIQSIEDAEGRTFAFGDVGSTSGYLIPYHHFTENLKIQPESFFGKVLHLKHQVIETQVAQGTLDLGADYNRNRNTMIEAGLISEEDSRVIWTSDPLPNDPFAVSSDLYKDQDLVDEIRHALAGIGDQLKTRPDLLPPHYTGFQKTDHANYQLIIDAGQKTGKLDAAMSAR